MKTETKFATGRTGWGSLWLVLILGTGFSLFVYFYLIKPQGPFCWDEAHHSTSSILIAKSLLEHDWKAFRHFTNIQIYWPFLHSWVSAIFLIVGGFSYSAARFTNLVIGFFSILLIYQTGRKLSSRNGSRIGLIAAILMSSSPMFLFYSSTAMIENLGLFLTLILIRSQFTALKKEKGRYYFISGLVLGLLFLTKYIYAVFFGVSLFFFYISLLLFSPQTIKPKKLWGRIGMMLIGFFLIWGIWMAVPPSAPKFDVLLYRIKDTGGWNPSDYSKLENRVFYLRSLLYAYTFSLGIYLLYLGGIIFSFICIKQTKVRLLLMVFLSSFITMSMIVNSQDRFIYVSTPALYLLTAVFINRLITGFTSHWKWLFWGLIGLIIMGDVPKLPAYIRQVGNAAMGACPFKIKNQFDYSTFFGLSSYPGFLRHPYPYFNPRAPRELAHHNSEDIINFIWKHTDPRGPICIPFYIGTLSPHLWHWHSLVNKRPLTTSWNPNCYYFVSLKVAPDSPYYTFGNKHLIEGRTDDWSKFLSELEQHNLIRISSRSNFPDIGMEIIIYAKTMPVVKSSWEKYHFP